jgi:hypothetical protein
MIDYHLFRGVLSLDVPLVGTKRNRERGKRSFLFPTKHRLRNFSVVEGGFQRVGERTTQMKSLKLVVLFIHIIFHHAPTIITVFIWLLMMIYLQICILILLHCIESVCRYDW